jgi:hypothetical protein
MRVRVKRFRVAAAVLLLAVFVAPEWPPFPVAGATAADCRCVAAGRELNS